MPDHPPTMTKIKKVDIVWTIGRHVVNKPWPHTTQHRNYRKIKISRVHMNPNSHSTVAFSPPIFPLNSTFMHCLRQYVLTHIPLVLLFFFFLILQKKKNSIRPLGSTFTNHFGPLDKGNELLIAWHC